MATNYCTTGYPASPALNLTSRQTMLCFAYLAYTGDGIASPGSTSSIATNITNAIPQIPLLCNPSTSTNPDWKIVWGPEVYTLAGAIYPENMMYVVQRISDPSQYVIAIRGTDFPSQVDWFLEDFEVLDLVCWPLAATTCSPAGAMISESSSIDLNALLNMGVTCAGNNSLITYLTAQAASGKINVCVTGHSLGGMLSSTLALYLLENQTTGETWDPNGTSSVSFVSFAGPTAGNQQFATYSNQSFVTAFQHAPPLGWDATLGTNGDVVQCSLDAAPMMYISSNVYTPGVGNTKPGPGPIFSMYAPAFTFSGIEWDAFKDYILPTIGGLTARQDYTQLATGGAQLTGILNTAIQPSGSSLTDQFGYFAAQAGWQHGNSYPNILGMCQWLLDPSIVVRNSTAITTTSLSPGDAHRKDDPFTVAVTISGSGFTAVQNLAVIAGPNIPVTIDSVTDTEIQASFGISIDTYRTTYDVVVTGTVGIGTITSNSQPFKVWAGL